MLKSLGLPIPYSEQDVIELRHYKDLGDDKEVTWYHALFHELLDSPRCPHMTKKQLEEWTCESDDHVLSLLRRFKSLKEKPLVMFLTIPFSLDGKGERVSD